MTERKKQLFRTTKSLDYDEDYVYYVTPEDEREVLQDFNYKVDKVEEGSYDSIWKFE